MRRGDFVTVVLANDLGKPRPALVVQSDQFGATATVTVLPLTSQSVDAPLLRVLVDPTPQNGLRCTSQVMIDKPTTIRREKVGAVFGVADDTLMLSIGRALTLFLGLG
jgi:mRNA interferase MazF